MLNDKWLNDYATSMIDGALWLKTAGNCHWLVLTKMQNNLKWPETIYNDLKQPTTKKKQPETSKKQPETTENKQEMTETTHNK